jgi:signal transduction histidine kinase
MNTTSVLPPHPAPAPLDLHAVFGRFRRFRLQTKLVISHVMVGALLTVLSLLAAHYVHGKADGRHADRAVVTAGVQELYSLVASASEEGFSYVLSGDVGERARFVAKLDAAGRRCDALSIVTLSHDERLSLNEVRRDVERLRAAGAAMFETYEATHRFAPDRYEAYEAAVDGTWDATAALDLIASTQTALGGVMARRDSYRFSLAIGLLAIAVAVGLGGALGRRLGQPLTALRDAAVAFGKGEELPTIPADDEIGDVVSAFETMKARVHENQRALIVTEQMAAIGRLTAGIVHELNSPLTALLLTAEEMKDLAHRFEGPVDGPAVAPVEQKRLAAEMLDCADIATLAATRAVEFVRSIRSQTRVTQGGQTERFDVVPVVKDAINIVRHAARAAKCEVALVADGSPLELDGVPSSLGQAVTNLLQNAIDVMGEHGGGRLTVRIDADAGQVRIHVTDTGPGIPAEVLRRIFEPLYTTKRYGKGTGLGLSIVKQAVERFAGHVAVDTRVGEGTTFTLSFPRRWIAGASLPPLGKGGVEQGAHLLQVPSEEHPGRPGRGDSPGAQ